MVERLHRQLNAALIARSERERWADHLPFLLLGVRSTLKEDISCPPVELVYRTTLHLPGDLLVTGTASPVDFPSYVHDFRELFRQLKPTLSRILPRHGIFISPDLRSSTHVYICRNGVKPPLTPPYDGLFPVLVCSAKTFTTDIGSRLEVIPLDCLKPAFFAANISLTPDPHGYVELLSPIIRKKSVPWDLSISNNMNSFYRLGRGELWSGLITPLPLNLLRFL